MIGAIVVFACFLVLSSCKKKETDFSKKYLDDHGFYTLELANTALFCDLIGPVLNKLGAYHQGIIIHAEHETEHKRWLLEYNTHTTPDYPVFNPLDFFIPRCDWDADGKTCNKIYFYESIAVLIYENPVIDTDPDADECSWIDRSLFAKHVPGYMLNSLITGEAFPDYYIKTYPIYTFFGIYHGKAAKWYENLDTAGSHCHEFARRFAKTLHDIYNVSFEDVTHLRSYVNFQALAAPKRLDVDNNAEQRQAVANYFYPDGKKSEEMLRNTNMSATEIAEEIVKFFNGEENKVFPMTTYPHFYSATSTHYYISSQRYDREGSEGMYFFEFQSSTGLIGALRIHQEYQTIPGEWY